MVDNIQILFEIKHQRNQSKTCHFYDPILDSKTIFWVHIFQERQCQELVSHETPKNQNANFAVVKDVFKITGYGHMKIKSLILCCQYSNPNPKDLRCG